MASLLIEARARFKLNRLDVLSRKAEELGQISAAARREELIGKHRGMFVDCTALLSDLDPDKMTPEVLDKLADHLIQRALKEKGLNSPEMVAEVGLRLEAGETAESIEATLEAT
jgi:hypothetical protein